MWASVVVFLVMTVVIASLIAAGKEVVTWLTNRRRYFLVVECRDQTVLEVFTRMDKWRDAFESQAAKARIDKTLLRVVQLEQDERGFMRTGFVFDRIDEVLDAGKKGGLTGEAKILTFPKRSHT